jgi:hypothetical protein
MFPCRLVYRQTGHQVDLWVVMLRGRQADRSPGKEIARQTDRFGVRLEKSRTCVGKDEEVYTAQLYNDMRR